MRRSLVAAALIVSFGAGYAANTVKYQLDLKRLRAERLADPSHSAAYLHRSSLFRTLPSGPTTVMIGDSLTASGNWDELLGPSVANRGISGDTTLGVLNRLAGSIPPSTRRVFLMIGTNDLKNYHARPKAVAAQTARIVEQLASKQVYLQSVLLTRSPVQNARIRDLNSLNQALCATGVCTYVDLNAVVAPNGTLSRQVSVDGLHVGGEGYRLWADRIRPLIAAPN